MYACLYVCICGCFWIFICSKEVIAISIISMGCLHAETALQQVSESLTEAEKDALLQMVYVSCYGGGVSLTDGPKNFPKESLDSGAVVWLLTSCFCPYRSTWNVLRMCGITQVFQVIDNQSVIDYPPLSINQPSTNSTSLSIFIMTDHCSPFHE